MQAPATKLKDHQGRKQGVSFPVLLFCGEHAGEETSNQFSSNVVELAKVIQGHCFLTYVRLSKSLVLSKRWLTLFPTSERLLFNAQSSTSAPFDAASARRAELFHFFEGVV